MKALVVTGILCFSASALAQTAGTPKELELFQNPELQVSVSFECPANTLRVFQTSPNGTEEFCSDEEGRREGYYIGWNKTDTAWRELGSFRRGKKHGVWRQFDQAGKVRERYFRHGKRAKAPAKKLSDPLAIVASR